MGRADTVRAAYAEVEAAMARMPGGNDDGTVLRMLMRAAAVTYSTRHPDVATYLRNLSRELEAGPR